MLTKSEDKLIINYNNIIFFLHLFYMGGMALGGHTPQRNMGRRHYEDRENAAEEELTAQREQQRESAKIRASVMFGKEPDLLFDAIRRGIKYGRRAKSNLLRPQEYDDGTILSPHYVPLEIGSVEFYGYWDRAIELNPKRALKIANERIKKLETKLSKEQDYDRTENYRYRLAMFQKIQLQAQGAVARRKIEDERSGIVGKVKGIFS